MPVPPSSYSPLIFEQERRVHAESTLCTEPTTLSPSKSHQCRGEVGSPRTGSGVAASHQPGVPAVGCLFILCDLALIGAKEQTQW